MDWKWLFTSFDGRINRAKFWAGFGVLFAGAIVAMIIDNLIGTTIEGLPYGWVYVLYGLASIYFGLALYAKRWHDRDKSWAWIFIAAIPFIGGIWALVENGFLPGTDGPNQYGQPESGSPFESESFAIA